MRQLVMVEFTTVDGVMQGLGSPHEDTDGGFRHGGWGARYADAIHEAVASDWPGRTTAYLFGRRTYEKMAAFWPHQPDDDPMARQLNTTPKHVATRTPTDFAWAGTRRLEGDLGDAVASLKDVGDGDIVLLGSGILAHELMRLALVDEIRMFVHPLLLGTGKRLFRDLPAPCELELTACSTTSRGTVFASYRVVHDKP